jgi:hypothetical protein
VAKKPAAKNEAPKKAAKTTARKKTSKKATKKPAAKKEAPKKAAKKTARKKTSKKAATGGKPKKRRRGKKRKPADEGMPMKEVRARLGLIRQKLLEMTWIEGIYLYGAELVDQQYLTQLKLIVFYTGLRTPAAQRSAQQELQELLHAVLPLELSIQLAGTPGMAELLEEGNPAAIALLGHTETVFAR